MFDVVIGTAVEYAGEAGATKQRRAAKTDDGDASGRRSLTVRGARGTRSIQDR